jgi:DNA-binding transcriptional ArsR family regulator
MTRIIDITDRQMVQALSHPVRRRVLAALRGRAASPAQLAKEFGESLGTISYHVRQLAAAKLIELVEERPRRGATEHFYIAVGRTVIPENVWADLPASAQGAVTSSWLTQVYSETVQALSSSKTRPSNPLLHRALLRLDDDAVAHLRAAAVKLYDLALELEAQAQPRLADNPAGERQTTLVTMLFPTASSAQD